MSNETIIKKWKMGLTVKQISKEYMRLRNKTLKRDEKKITALEAQAYIEPIIFKYQTELIKGGQA